MEQNQDRSAPWACRCRPTGYGGDNVAFRGGTATKDHVGGGQDADGTRFRYRAVAGPARIPGPSRVLERAAALPSLMWAGWALRLMPPGDFSFLRYRAALAVMLAVAVTGAQDYGTAQELLGLEPFHSSRLATFTARLRQDGFLEPVTAAICQLARKLDEHGAPIDYTRHRRLRRFSQARLDVTAWRRQRHILARRASLPAAAVQEQLGRLRLIELLTGTHPRYLPDPLRLPGRSQNYDEFVFTMPEQMAFCLHQQARALLSKASAILTSQLRQLEIIVGAALLRTGPDGRLKLTAYSERFARDVLPALTRAVPEPEHQPRSVTTMRSPNAQLLELPLPEHCSTACKVPGRAAHLSLIPTAPQRSEAGALARPGYTRDKCGRWPGGDISRGAEARTT